MNNQTKKNIVTCADIGGSHISVAMIDLDSKTAATETYVRHEVNSKGTMSDILTTWTGAIKEAGELSGRDISKIALAMPGPFDYENGISYIRGLHKYESLYGRNIKSFLAEELGISPQNVRFRNDAEAAIAGEVLAGGGRGFDNVLGVTMGTGFGSAHFSNGHTRDLNLGGESFKNSIADDYLSTRWFLKRYFDLTGISAVGVKELAQLALSSPIAKDVFREFAGNMIAFLTDHISRLNPDTLIIGGNIAKSSALFLPYMDKKLNLKITIAKLGEHAALFGAAALFESKIDYLPETVI